MTATDSSATGLYADGCPGRFQTGTKAVRDELIHVLVLETLVVALYLLCDSDRLVTALIIPRCRWRWASRARTSPVVPVKDTAARPIFLTGSDSISRSPYC